MGPREILIATALNFINSFIQTVFIESEKRREGGKFCGRIAIYTSVEKDKDDVAKNGLIKE